VLVFGMADDGLVAERRRRSRLMALLTRRRWPEM
jgi:hypothetical protein